MKRYAVLFSLGAFALLAHAQTPGWQPDLTVQQTYVLHRASSADPNSWIKPGAKPLEFRTEGQRQNVTLAPINSIFGKRYSVYWQVS